MPTPDFLAQTDDQARKDVELRELYRQWAKSFVYTDLMSYLEDSVRQSQNIGGPEMENLDKKALYLHDAYVYGKVISYITDMVDVAQQ